MFSRPPFRSPLSSTPDRGIPLLLVALLAVLLVPALSASAQQAERPAERVDAGIHAGDYSRDDTMRRDGRCVSDCDCPPGKLCSPKTARCETAFCPQVFQPVCGLDGKTYPNRCRAEAEHVVVAHEGECEEMGGGDETGATCGGIAGIRCPEGQVCDLPVGQCDGRDLQGRCVPQPEMCPENYEPVCGCDGKTYSNDCFRLMAGVQKAHDGECRDRDDDGPGEGGPGVGPGQKPDFCRSNDDCPQRAYCQLPGMSCEGRGRCAPRPDVCTKEFDPVCGCDGRTYGNACTAAANGVSIARKGRCEG